MKSYVLVGNYGAGNFGDDALLTYFLLRYPEVRWRIVTQRPQVGEFPRLPGGLRSFFSLWWRTIAAIRRSDGLVYGGGSLFTDLESSYACVYWSLYALVARIFRKRVIIAFQGIGPFRMALGERCALHVARYASLIIVRDRGSYDRIAAWGLAEKCIRSFDPVITLFERGDGRDAENALVLIPRRNSGEAFRAKADEAKLRGVYASVRVLLLQPGDTREQMYCRSLADAYGADIVPVRSTGELVSAVRGASLVLSERFHGALCALALGKRMEVVPQGEGDKLSWLSSLKMSECDALVGRGDTALRAALS